MFGFICVRDRGLGLERTSEEEADLLNKVFRIRFCRCGMASSCVGCIKGGVEGVEGAESVEGVVGAEDVAGTTGCERLSSILTPAT